MMEEDIIARLKADTTVNGLISGRVAFGRAGQKWAYPYLRLTKVSDVEDYHLTASSDMAQSRVQIDAIGTSYQAVTALIRAVRASLSGASFGAVQACFIVLERDDTDTGAADQPFMKSLDVSVVHSL